MSGSHVLREDEEDEMAEAEALGIARRRSFAHCQDYRETAAVYSWLRRN